MRRREAWTRFVGYHRLNCQLSRRIRMEHMLRGSAWRPVMETLVWMRVPGDLVFAVGVFAFAVFVAQAFWSVRKVRNVELKPAE
jgi:nitric oxide reductase large subunit